MDDNKNKVEEITAENDIISWEVSDRPAPARGKLWYFFAGIAGLLMIFYAIMTSNFIFAVIVVFAGILIFLLNKEKPRSYEVALTDEGVRVGKEFYSYEQLDNFFIIYRPNEGLKNLYLEFKRFARPELPQPSKFSYLLWLLNFARTRLSLPLGDMNPLLIRKNLLKYLKEDLEKIEPPLSEQLTEIFRL